MLRVTAFEDRLKDWLKDKTHWRPNVLNFTNGFLDQGLQARGITRDLDWGVAVPIDGWEDRRIYVWFEAVIGYLSASKEWAQHQGDPEMWREFWQNPLSRAYYFMAKDNVPFHTIIWPAMLLGYTDHNLPYDIPSNEQIYNDSNGTIFYDEIDQIGYILISILFIIFCCVTTINSFRIAILKYYNESNKYNHLTIKNITEKEQKYLLNECSICLDNLKINENIYILPCKHIFHCKCIIHWLEEETTCPLCRSDINPD